MIPKRKYIKRPVAAHELICIFADSDSPMTTRDGGMTYREWCEGEVRRMQAKGQRCHLVEQHGQVAVARGARAVAS